MPIDRAFLGPMPANEVRTVKSFPVNTLAATLLVNNRTLAP